jgi:FkbM family methyltransferase
MRKWLKRTGKKLLGLTNFNIPRTLNGVRVVVPVRCGVKAGITGEKWMSDLLQRLFRYTGDSFLDVGVNLGQTLIKVKTVDPARDYIGIEPNPACIFYLQQLTSVNAWPNTRIVPVGIYTQECLLNLTGRNDTDGSSTIIDEFKPDHAGDAVSSRLVPLFSFHTVEKALHPTTIGIVKIDVEGGELEVMENLSFRLRKDRPVIIIEVWRNEGNALKTERSEKLKTLIADLGYSVFSWDVSDDKNRAINFREASLGEHTGTDNYLLLPNENRDDIRSLFVSE